MSVDDVKFVGNVERHHRGRGSVDRQYVAKRRTKVGFRCDTWQRRVDVFVGVVLLGLLICVCPTWEMWKSGKVRVSSTMSAATFLRAVAPVSNLTCEKRWHRCCSSLAPVSQSQLGNVLTDAVRFSVTFSQVWRTSRIASRMNPEFHSDVDFWGACCKKVWEIVSSPIVQLGCAPLE